MRSQQHPSGHGHPPQRNGKILFFLLLLFFPFFLPACSQKTLQPPVPDTETLLPSEKEETGKEVFTVPVNRTTASESSYYYYTEAQIRLNRNRPLEAIGFLRQAAALDSQSAYLQRELAALLIRANQPKAALQAIERARDLNPEDPDTLIVLAGIRQMLAQDIEELIPLYEEVLRLDPHREKVYLILGNLYLSQKEALKAENIYRKFIELRPENYAGYYYLGQLLSILEREEEALQNFDRVIEMVPQLLEPYLERIKILSRQLTRDLSVEIRPGDTLDALLARHSGPPSARLRRQVLALNPLITEVDHLEKGKKLLMPPKKNHPLVQSIRKAYEDILNLESSSIEIIMDFSIFLWQTGNEKEAMDHMAQLAAEESLRETAVKRIFSTLMENKRYRDAIFLLETLLSGDPENGEIHYALGLAHQEAGMKDAARTHYMAISPADPAYRKAVVHLAYMDQQENAIERGIATLEAAATANPEDATLRFYLGAFYEEAGHLEAAAEIFSNSLTRDEKDQQIRYRLGVVLDKMGQKEKAIAEMETLIQQNPDHANALNYLGYTLTEMEIRLDEAESFIRRAMDLKPQDGYITDSMGWVYFKQGKPEKALLYLEKAAALLPEDPAVLEHLGDVYAFLGRVEAAQEAYKKSLLFEKKPLVLQKLEALKQGIPSEHKETP